MTWLRAVAKFVDRDVARWGDRSMMLILCVLPILLLDLAFDGPPTEAPPAFLIAALILSALAGGFVIWREARLEWRDWRRFHESVEPDAAGEKREG